MKTIDEVIDYIVKTSTTTKEQGDKFELACKFFLQNDPYWSKRLSKVYLWNEAPIEITQGKPDTGIDLVAVDTHNPGKYVAIQSKCYLDSSSLTKGDVDSFYNEAGKPIYSGRIIMTTAEKISSHARESQIVHSSVLIQRFHMNTVDWEPFLSGKGENFQAIRPIFELREHQKEAIESTAEGFEAADRGKLIMACGTGKTFTALRLAEKLTPTGTILFLAPSISLISQTIAAWNQQAQKPFRTLAVCSDRKVSRAAVKQDGWQTSIHDIPFPATTDALTLRKSLDTFTELNAANPQMTVIFATYQSIQVVIDAQRAMATNESDEPNESDFFDLVICDEAHRTTGAREIGTSADEQSHFTLVHDSDILKASKRLYMTATPRIYGSKAKETAKSSDFLLASMDDPAIYGETFYELKFGDAVHQGLLTDYKVAVMVVDEDMASKAFQEEHSDDDGLLVSERAKIIGAWNALAFHGKEASSFEGGKPPATPLKRAVAFASTIKESEQLARYFPRITQAYELRTMDNTALKCEVKHIDGTMDSQVRNELLGWLKSSTLEENTTRILSNARCLSEGVDVPTLDAVIFMKPRRSMIDIIQAVGRVMRKARDKEYGYIILPVFVPVGQTPEEALNKNKAFEVVWEVLQALRSHDERIEAYINAVRFDNEQRKKGDAASGLIAADNDTDSPISIITPEDKTLQLALEFPIEDWRDAIHIRLVSKVGRQVYWEEWAKDVAEIAKNQTDAIDNLLSSEDKQIAEAFGKFLTGLRDSLNDSITQDAAVEMLSQHLITKPIFDALFSGYEFAKYNPVSIAMEGMLETLEQHGFPREDPELELFYKDVRRRLKGLTTDGQRQGVIKELYEKFFTHAFPRTSQAMGIVYTPEEVVDFIINSVVDILREEFGVGIADESVHILDPFTGTGTFIVNLIRSGFFTPEELAKKYANNFHANEIVLLAYYIATINIEHTYHAIMGGDYVPFNGAVLTDTFQMSEDNDALDIEVFTENSERVLQQNEIPIKIVLGNPPYSIGQKSENDDNQNVKYPRLDGRIAETYAKESGAGLKKGLYDSYIRAFRWASDRIGDAGIVCYVSNAGWLDAQGMDGFRKCLSEEFDVIYVFNLRGNQRTSGETSRKEGGKIFGAGSRTPIAITMLVRKPISSEEPRNVIIRYCDIGDYLSREEKLGIISDYRSFDRMTKELVTIVPDGNNDWVSQRDEAFNDFEKLGDQKYKEPMGIFQTYSLGLVTNRDAWAYNFSRVAVSENMRRLIKQFNKTRQNFAEDLSSISIDAFVDNNPEVISWTRRLKDYAKKNTEIDFDESGFKHSLYRPFVKQWLYYSKELNEMTYQQPRLFPLGKGEGEKAERTYQQPISLSPSSEKGGVEMTYQQYSSPLPNLVIAVTGVSASRDFSCMITDVIPNLDMQEKAQCFPLYWYEEQEELGGLFAEGNGDGFIQHDGITDTALQKFQAHYSDTTISKKDIFYYIYGVLHSLEYRTRFADNLKKELPRVPYAPDFRAFSEAGRKLADFHLNYEIVEPYPLEELHAGVMTTEPAVTGCAFDYYRVEKMRHPKVKNKEGKNVNDRTIIHFNDRIVLSNIPEEAWDYVVNGQSALWWIMDRYRIKTDKASQITNDPNDWCKEVNDPRYILDLIKRITTVSLKTIEIVRNLPGIEE